MIKNYVGGFMLALGLSAALAAAAAELPGLPVKSPVTTAPLVNFEHPDRIRDSYFVGFKAVDKARVAVSAVANRQVLARGDLLPENLEYAEAIANAMVPKDRGTVGAMYERRKGRGVRGFWVTLSEQEVRKLAEDPRVEYIEANVAIRISGSQALPTDNSLWHLDRIDQVGLPLNRTYRYDSTEQGAGAFVYVIDTGVRTTHHEFLHIFRDVIDCSVPNSTADCRASGVVAPYRIQDPDEQDCQGHGTAVASLITGQTLGVAGDTGIQAVKFTKGCTAGGDAQTFSNALYFVLHDMYGPQTIVNISASWTVPAGGTTPISVIVEQLVQDILDDHATVVAAAGNDNGSACTQSPARMSLGPGLISVGASNIADQKVADSNYGACVDLYAPGANINAAGITSDSAFQGGWTGTSFAAPIVSGIAALYRSGHLQATNSELKSDVIAHASANQLTNIGADSINRLANNKVSGIDYNAIPDVNPPRPADAPPDDPAKGDQVGMVNVLVPFIVS